MRKEIYENQESSDTLPFHWEFGKEEIPVETDGGYLFAHMTNANYGKLYYAVSRDGINWETLNKGRIINSAYIGHPDICQGHDGAFYMIAVNPLALWRSENLVTWTSTQLNEMIFSVDCYSLRLSLLA